MPALRHKYSEAIDIAIANAEPGESSQSIYEHLTAAFAKWGIPEEEWPAERTVERRRSEQKGRDLRPLRDFRWPEDIQAGLFPPEASAALLGLFSAYQERGVSYRPSVRTCRWYWLLTQAGFSENRTTRKLAWRLSALEAEDQLKPEVLRAIEALMAAGSLSEYLRRVDQGFVQSWDFLTGTSEFDPEAKPQSEFGDLPPDELQAAIVRAQKKESQNGATR